MKDSDFKRKLFWECINNLGSKGRSSAAKLAEPALHIPQQTNGAGAKATLPPDCLECAFGLCCDRSGPVEDGSCFEQRR